MYKHLQEMPLPDTSTRGAFEVDGPQWKFAEEIRIKLQSFLGELLSATNGARTERVGGTPEGGVTQTSPTLVAC